MDLKSESGIFWLRDSARNRTFVREQLHNGIPSKHSIPNCEVVAFSKVVSTIGHVCRVWYVKVDESGPDSIGDEGCVKVDSIKAGEPSVAYTGEETQSDTEILEWFQNLQHWRNEPRYTPPRRTVPVPAFTDLQRKPKSMPSMGRLMLERIKRGLSL